MLPDWDSSGCVDLGSESTRVRLGFSTHRFLGNFRCFVHMRTLLSKLWTIHLPSFSVTPTTTSKELVKLVWTVRPLHSGHGANQRHRFHLRYLHSTFRTGLGLRSRMTFNDDCK